MQKLIFRNANGVEVDLTSGNFGITEWKGFSDVSLNLQTQQVPFQDGSVYLDGLLGNREISVTLAVNDNNDLEKRYELRRNLIEILNPKLGEGTLIYKNDYLMRQIKGVPLLPVFKNKNSNDRGTLKANLAWTCPNPYWEDVDETRIYLTAGARQAVQNDGDVPCQVKAYLSTTNATNPQLKNLTQNKKIKLNGTFHNGILINTNIGEKSVISEGMSFKNLYLGFTLKSIIFSESLEQFFALSENGQIFTSPDGINWNYKSKAYSQRTNKIIYVESLNLFVVVGDGGIITSPDGINWTVRYSDEHSLLGVSYSESLHLFVAVGGYGLIITSPDGINWTKLNIATNYSFRSITFSEKKGLFIAVGYNGLIFKSSDGINWTARTISGNENTYYTCVIYSEFLSLFVVVGNNNKILISSDANNWRESAIKYGISDLIYSGSLNLFIGVSGKKIYISSDGENWNSISTELSSYHDGVYSVAYSESLGLAVAVGYKGVQVNSSDGKLWNVIKDYSESLYSVAYSESLNLFVAVGYDGIITSSDGINWTKLNITISLRGIIYSESLHLFVAVGDSNEKIITSSDGINWTARTISGLETGLYAIVYSESLHLFVAVGARGGIITSPDGINWTVRETNLTNDLKSIAYSENLNLFVVVGDPVIITSPDGINWTSSQAPNLTSVAYSEYLNLFVASGFGYLLTSSDGINWTQIASSGYSFTSIVYSDQLQLFVSNTGAFSSDGANWFQPLNPAGIAVTYSENLNLFVIVGEYGEILLSDFTLYENLISSLSTDSDMTLSLEKGSNDILLNRTSGSLSGQIRYRQKYIGV